MSVDVPGAPLPLVLPEGLVLSRVVGSGLKEVLLEADSPASVFVGRLTIPTLVQGRIRLCALDIPLPPPWRWGDIRSMLAAVQRLALDYPASVGGLHSTLARSVFSRSNLVWEALNRCSTAASAALTRWPSRDHRRMTVHPLELSRGTEVIDATERILGSQIDLLRGKLGRVAPMATVRRVGSAMPWRSRSLGAVAEHVCHLVAIAEEKGKLGESPEILIAPIRALAHRARPEIPLQDPPLSSWPPVLAEAYVAAHAVLGMVVQGGREIGWTPLSNIWRLYEIWIVERTVAILKRLLGPPTYTPDEDRVSAGWSRGSWKLELYHPCRFGRQPQEMVGRTWWSVSSELIPDVVLVANSRDGPRLVILDPKNRGALSRGELAQEASKYLWGIRRDDNSTFGTTAVVLVSPYGGDRPYDPDSAMQWSIHGHPNAPQGVAPGQLGTDIDSDFFRSLLVDYLKIPIDR